MESVVPVYSRALTYKLSMPVRWRRALSLSTHLDDGRHRRKGSAAALASTSADVTGEGMGSGGVKCVLAAGAAG